MYSIFNSLSMLLLLYCSAIVSFIYLLDLWCLYYLIKTVEKSQEMVERERRDRVGK